MDTLVAKTNTLVAKAASCSVVSPKTLENACGHFSPSGGVLEVSFCSLSLASLSLSLASAHGSALQGGCWDCSALVTCDLSETLAETRSLALSLLASFPHLHCDPIRSYVHASSRHERMCRTHVSNTPHGHTSRTSSSQTCLEYVPRLQREI